MRLIHKGLGAGGTLWANVQKSDRPIYEEAMRRYQGPARIVICQEAYLPPRQAIWEADIAEGTQLLPDWFSVHVTNFDELPEGEMTVFYHLLQQVRMEHQEVTQ